MISITAVLAGAVVMIYLVKLKRRGLLISSSLIWREVLKQNRAESLMERLRWWISLILQVAFVGLIVAALAQPKLNSAGDGSTVVILDASASMLARSPSDLNRTRFELAQAAASRLIHSLPGTESMMIVRLGATNDTLEPFTSEREKLQSAIDHTQPSEAPSDINAALALANQSLSGRVHPKIVLITDGGLSPDAIAKSPIKPELIQVGSPVDNVGITAFSIRQQYVDLPDYQLYYEISNFGRSDQTFDVKFYQGDDLISTKPISLRARSTIQQSFSDFSPKGGPIRLELDINDAFPLDNKAFAYLPPRRAQRGLLVTNGNLFLESALSADPTVDLKKVSPAQFDERADYDLIVFDGVAPKYSGKSNTLYLNPQGEFSPVATDGDLKQAQISQYDGQHPLLKYISFKDLSIKNVPKLKAGQGDTVLARAGNDPIVIAREQDGRRTVVLAFDMKVSDKADLPLRAAFPILIENALHWFANERTINATTSPIGQPVLFEQNKGSKAGVKNPDGTTTDLATDGSFLPVKTGYYEIKAGNESQVVSVNLVSASESDLIPRDGLDRVTSKIVSQSGGWFVNPIWFYLALVGFALASVEWFTYQRRVTV
ncbi:MAG TPA: BatA and WFA domain-containing protein [Blastocatellia bacterium]|nr:BatA and WFA domain-containing protein [Blastocatellia bacterium]